MAIGYIQNDGNGGNGVSSPRTLNITVSASCSLLLIAKAGSQAITTATIGGQSFFAIDNTTFGASMELWGIVNPPVGVQTITINWATGTDTYDLDAIQYSGTSVLSGSVCLQKTSTSGTGTLNATVTTTFDNSWLFLVLASLTNSGTISAGTNTIKRVGNGTNNIISGTFDSNAGQTPPGAFSLQVTNAQPNSNLLMVSILPFVTSGGAFLYTQL